MYPIKSVSCGATAVVSAVLTMCRFINTKAYSDLDTKLADGRVIHCHKIVLCECPKTDYFRTLCGPDSHFAVSTGAVGPWHST